MTYDDLERAANRFGSILSDLDSNIFTLADKSQRAARADLQTGDTVQRYGRRSIVAEDCSAEAERLQSAARDSIDEVLDELDRKADAHVSEAATADELASVAFVLDRGDVTDAELAALYDRYRNKWAIARVLRREAAKRGASIGEPEAADVYLENKAEARRYAESAALGRWHTQRTDLSVMPVSWAASQLLEIMTGTDMFVMPR